MKHSPTTHIRVDATYARRLKDRARRAKLSLVAYTRRLAQRMKRREAAREESTP